MANELDDIESSLFVSLHSSNKSQRRSSRQTTPPTNQKLFDTIDDDILDLLSDNDESQSGSRYIPSSANKRKPLDLPFLKQKQVSSPTIPPTTATPPTIPPMTATPPTIPSTKAVTNTSPPIPDLSTKSIIAPPTSDLSTQSDVVPPTSDLSTMLSKAPPTSDLSTSLNVTSVMLTPSTPITTTVTSSQVSIAPPTSDLSTLTTVSLPRTNRSKPVKKVHFETEDTPSVVFESQILSNATHPISSTDQISPTSQQQGQSIDKDCINRIETLLTIKLQELQDKQETRLKETLTEVRESYLKELDSYKCHMLSTQQQIINQLQENHRLSIETSQDGHIKTLTDQLQEITKFYNKFEETISKEVKVEQVHLKAQQNQIEERECQLLKQQDMLESDRQKVYQLIEKLEQHLYQKEREIQQKQWTISQNEGKLKARLAAFEEDKLKTMTTINEERQLLQKSKEEFLREQQLLLQHCYKLSHEFSLVEENQQRQSIKKIESDLMILRGQVQEERDHLNYEQTILKEQQQDIQKERKEISKEKERLEALQTELEMRAVQINEAAKRAEQMYSEGLSSLQKAQQLQAHFKDQFTLLHQEQLKLKEKEKQLMKERMILMRDQRQQDSSPLVSTSPTNSESLLKQLELSESLRKIIKKNEKDDNKLKEEKEFLHVLVQTPSVVL